MLLTMSSLAKRAGAFALGCALLSNACASGDDVSLLEPKEVTTDPELELATLTKDRLEGTYRHEGVTLDFAAERSDAGFRWRLRKDDGTELFSVEQVGGSSVITVLGEYRQYLDAAPRAALERLEPGALDQDTLAALAPSEGDPALFYELRRTPEYGELPRLSQRLGERGITGKAYPAVLPLHLFALGAARAARATPNDAEPNASVTGLEELLEKGLSPPGGLPCTRQGTQTCCVNPTNGQRTCFTPPPPPPPPPPCVAQYPGDLRCDPNNDSCLGLCGDECSCWEWVCGDCRWHFGCFQHDWFCRQAESASALDWLLRGPELAFYASECASIGLVIAAFGC